MTVVVAARATLPRHDLSGGSVVAVLAVITLAALATVLALSYAMYLRSRR
ncbi:MAG: hypothetical protein M3N98_02165 [Actinomycetota bacterium]|nr:hypothetical protein [Actinomycetota bacterium]